MKTLSYNGQEELVEKFNVTNNGIEYTFELTMKFATVSTDLEKQGTCNFFMLTRDNGSEKGIICRGTNALTSSKLVSLMSKLGYELNVNFSRL